MERKTIEHFITERLSMPVVKAGNEKAEESESLL